jgi:hypothetical protein
MFFLTFRIRIFLQRHFSLSGLSGGNCSAWEKTVKVLIRSLGIAKKE